MLRRSRPPYRFVARISLPVAALLLPQAAFAQSGTVTFDGLILPTCSVVPGLPGTLGTAEGGTVLTSEAGTSATAAVTATGFGYEVAVDAPTGFTLAPSGADTGTTYSASYEASGATLLSLTLGGTTLAINLGTTNLTIDAEARRSAEIFPAGAYQMVATVRCVSP